MRWVGTIFATAMLLSLAPAAVRGEAVEIPVSDGGWFEGQTWDKLNRQQITWRASAQNLEPDSRKICVSYELLDASGLVLTAIDSCRVVPPKEEADFSGDGYLARTVAKQIKTSRVRALSNPIYYPREIPPTAEAFVTPSPVAPPPAPATAAVTLPAPPQAAAPSAPAP